MLAVIGGSGVYDIDGLAKTRWMKVDSPFGAPSDELLMGELDGQPLAFLPRHGRGHQIPPSEINFHANIDAPVAFQLDADPGVAAAQRGGIGFRQRIACVSCRSEGQRRRHGSEWRRAVGSADGLAL